MNKFVAFSLSFQTHKKTSNFCQMRPRAGCNCAHEIVTKYAWFPIRKYRPLYKSINAQDMIVYYPIIIEFIWLLLQCIARQKYAIQGQISPTICSRVRMNVVSVCASVLPVDFFFLSLHRVWSAHTHKHTHTPMQMIGSVLPQATCIRFHTRGIWCVNVPHTQNMRTCTRVPDLSCLCPGLQIDRKESHTCSNRQRWTMRNTRSECC